MHELATRRTDLERELGEARAEWLRYRGNPRLQLDLAKQREDLKPADNISLLAAQWLDAGRAEIARRGGGVDTIQAVARQWVASTRDTHLAGVSAELWADALAKWPGWAFGRTGRPKAGEKRPRPDALLADLLRAAGLKTKRPRIIETVSSNRDAEGIRASVNRARKAVGLGRAQPHGENV